MSPYDAKKLHKLKYPEKYAARNTLYQAIKKGRVKRSACEVCGDLKSEAHHEDYSKPLDVKWLCRKHHMDVHGGRWRDY